MPRVRRGNAGRLRFPARLARWRGLGRKPKDFQAATPARRRRSTGPATFLALCGARGAHPRSSPVCMDATRAPRGPSLWELAYNTRPSPRYWRRTWQGPGQVHDAVVFGLFLFLAGSYTLSQLWTSLAH